MQRFWETVLGLERGFLRSEGDFALRFNPQWPLQESVGAGTWNFVLGLAAVALVVFVYRREGRSRPARITLGVMRAVLLGFVILLLNRPMLTLGQSRTEPSVLAIMIDKSQSMVVRDGAEADGSPPTRLEAAVELLTDEERGLLRSLAAEHVIHFYEFDRDARPVGTLSVQGEDGTKEGLREIVADGQTTQVLQSLRTVLQELQGRRLAGVIVLTDGRETPARPIAESLRVIQSYGVPIFPIPLGSEDAPRNIAIQGVNMQETAFAGDIISATVTVRATGYVEDHPVRLMLLDDRTGAPLVDSERRAVERTVYVPDDQPFEVELQFMPAEPGTLDVRVEAEHQTGELDAEDNIRVTQVAVLDAEINVLYVDGYPRWEYRYIRDEMIRDDTVRISLLLTSADPTFHQDGNRPITRFPESIEELMDYDAVVFGDVDPRQFTDHQLQLVQEFVSERGGGFGMVSGERWSPHAYRNTAIEVLLPVALDARPTRTSGTIARGFRPVITGAGRNASIFRFFADREVNERYLEQTLVSLFWYARGVTVKPGVGEVYAEHPEDVGADGRSAPLLVVGRFGTGRTLFSAIDDTWRWRFYTGETIFDTYWVQSFRYLARGRKLGERRMMFSSERPSYELGEQVRVRLRVVDPELLRQLPEQLRVEVLDEAGQPVRQELLIRQERQEDLYIGSFAADQVGRWRVRLPQAAGGVEAMELPVEVRMPRLELLQPQVDRTLLSRLAAETLGETMEYDEAAERLPGALPSAAQLIPVETSRPLWDAPLALIIFVSLITIEWVMRKIYGMV